MTADASELFRDMRDIYWRRHGRVEAHEREWENEEEQNAREERNRENRKVYDSITEALLKSSHKLYSSVELLETTPYGLDELLKKLGD